MEELARGRRGQTEEGIRVFDDIKQEVAAENSAETVILVSILAVFHAPLHFGVFKMKRISQRGERTHI